MSKKVLITGARAPVAIDLSRSFMAAGYAPILADSVYPWAAKASKSRARPICRHPKPRYEFEQFSNWLKAYVRDEKPALIIPTCEEVFYVAAAAQNGGFLDRVFTSKLETLKILHSKIDFPNLLDTLGVTAPKTWRIRRQSDLDTLPRPLNEYVFKPEYSRFGTATLIRPDLKTLENISFKTGLDWAAQSFIAGDEICFWSIAREGEIIGHAAYKPLWRYGRSAAYAFKHVQSEAALHVAQSIAKAINYTGHLSFDIILTPNGEAIPIECNPRAVSGLHLLDAQSALAQTIMGQTELNIEVADRRHISLAMACLGLPSAILSRRLPAFLSDWKASSDVLGRPGDKGPIAGAMLDAARFTFTGLGRFKTATAETTDDIEWNGQALV
ncbi:MAG: hypothetical protein ABJG88_02150 [Litorimonas sp.]